tara:strand:- start:1282 stop:2535 length:1254 start_codon:yes stop_codon:yes gene_type:complete
MNNTRFLSLLLAYASLKKNRLRTGLTLFGIMVGIALVIVVQSLGSGAQSLILGQVSSFGDDWINIEIKVPAASKASRENAAGVARGIEITTLTYKDMQAISKLSNIKDAYAGITTQVVASYKEEKMRPYVFGVTSAYQRINKDELAAGRFFTKEEERGISQVVVLGSQVKENLFAENTAVGKLVTVDGKKYRVIGVMEEVGSKGFIDMDKNVYIPLRTVQKKIMGINHVLWIISQTKDNSLAESTADEIRFLMRQRHDISSPEKQDFSVTTMGEALDIIGNVGFGINILLLVLAGISLIVAGVGIMNVMYVSVAERTFEIGLRKAIGATEKNILYQFLVEAILLTLFGGIIGIIVGIGVAYGVALGANYAGLNWAFTIPPSSIFLSVSFSIAVGLFFGIYPARKASKLNPIAAIRKE